MGRYFAVKPVFKFGKRTVQPALGASDVAKLIHRRAYKDKLLASKPFQAHGRAISLYTDY